MSLNPDAGRLIALVEKQTGYRVTLGTTEGLATDAQMISASASNPAHLINISTRSLAVADYVTAVQCVMLLTMWSHPRGVPQFEPIEERVDQAVREAAQSPRLAKYSKEAAAKTANSLVTGLLLQLRSTPSELIAMEYIRRECPSLHRQQADTVNAILRRNSQGLKPEVKEFAPAEILEKSLLLCAVVALLWGQISGSTAAMLPYKSIGLDTKAEELLADFRAVPGELGERSQAVVDAWAEKLQLLELYEWTFRPK
jgi:hypothetical protein